MRQNKLALIIADLGFGDAGKGTITDFLTRQLSPHTVVRYNGGPQAAHTVVTSDGQYHTFSQFGSGTLIPHTRTLLSRFMLINPLNMLKEERHLRSLGITDALQRTQIDRRALVITPFQKAINRLRERARAADRHGSCGEGIGECMADALKYGNAILYAGDLQDRATIIKKLRFLREAKYAELAALLPLLPDIETIRQELAIFTTCGCIEDCADVYQYFSDCLKIVDEANIHALFSAPGCLLFEGAQGVLLDENYGFAPYTTWSTSTFANAETLMQEQGYTSEVIKIGILRAYATRHGAGPFPTADQTLTRTIPDQHNNWNDWQQTFRVGYFDLVTTRYAMDVAGKPDYLAITNRDRLAKLPEWQMCTSYRYCGTGEEGLHDYLEQDEDGRIQAIKVPQPADLVHQEKLTQRLFACQPEYQSFPTSTKRTRPEEMQGTDLAILEQRLSVPIAISSCGPTSSDKHCSLDFQKHVLQRGPHN
jgi:adenylosuccinate synthase